MDGSKEISASEQWTVFMLCIVTVLLGWVTYEFRKAHNEASELRKSLAYWECTDRTPEQPLSPTLIGDAE